MPVFRKAKLREQLNGGNLVAAQIYELTVKIGDEASSRFGASRPVRGGPSWALKNLTLRRAGAPSAPN